MRRQLTEVFAKAHQFLTFTTPPNLQSAVAFGLAKPRGHFDDMRAQLARARDRLALGLQQEGFRVLPAAGTYFIGRRSSRLGHRHGRRANSPSAP